MSYAIGEYVLVDSLDPVWPGELVKIIGTLQNRPDWYNVTSFIKGHTFAVHEEQLSREA